MRERSSFLLPSLFIAVAVLSAGSTLARADESADLAFKVEGPADAVSCTTTPPTVTVFGLVVDLSKTAFDDSSSNDSSTQSSSDDDESNGGCAALTVGNPVELTLAGDTDPLAALKAEAAEGDKAELLGPIQAIDVTNHTLTLYGVTIDASQATSEGDDDDGQPAGPVDLTQLAVGQSVEVTLNASALPALVATRIEAKNFTNQVTVNVDDENGQQIGDDDSVDASVDQTVMVSVPFLRKNGTVGARRVRHTIHMQLHTGGHFVISGLAKGPATLKLTRVVASTTTGARRAIVVRKNLSRNVMVRLHRTRAR